VVYFPMTMVGGGEQIETVHAPAVADIQRRIVARPHWLADQPLGVEPHLWHEARAQLEAVLKDRGWPLLADGRCDRINFLLAGVPIVMAGD
jgi:hypothetical protein